VLFGLESEDKPTVQRLPSEPSELNLAPTSSDEELARSRNIERLINVNHHRAPSRTIYFDRFIPSRTGSNFALLHLPPERPEDSAYSRLRKGKKKKKKKNKTCGKKKKMREKKKKKKRRREKI
jgi:hypothetical protein